jgi:hypothetical protein
MRLASWGALVLLPLALVAAGGCGSSDEQRELTGAERSRLLGHLSDARAARAESDRGGTERALAALRREVDLLARDRALDESRLKRLRTGIRRARRLAPAELAEPISRAPRRHASRPGGSQWRGGGEGEEEGDE